LRNLNPRRWSRERRSLSISLSERLPSITLRALAEEGAGAGGTDGISSSCRPISDRLTSVREPVGTSDADRRTNPLRFP
jgi:hypothetical protein